MSGIRYSAVELLPRRWWYCAEDVPDHQVAGRLWKVGYCAAEMVCPACGFTGDVSGRVCLACLGDGYLERTDPCTGHASVTDALAHWVLYLVDHADYERVGPDVRICEAPGCTIETQHFVRVRDAEAALCHLHRNPEDLEALLIAEAVSA